MPRRGLGRGLAQLCFAFVFSALLPCETEPLDCVPLLHYLSFQFAMHHQFHARGVGVLAAALRFFLVPVVPQRTENQV